MKDNSVMVDGIVVNTKKEDFIDCNMLEVEAGTTGFMGGDSGHGCRTYLRVVDRASSDMRVSKFQNGFSIMLGGDSELRTILQALKFMVRTLEKDIVNNELKSNGMDPLE